MKKIIIAALGILILQNTVAQVDRSKKPAAGPAPVISIKDPVIFTMPNGMTVLVVENHKLPKVRATLNIDAGPIKEGKKAGVMQLMGQMLGEGTASMSKAQFDEATDMIGADVNRRDGIVKHCRRRVLHARGHAPEDGEVGGAFEIEHPALLLGKVVVRHADALERFLHLPA